MNSSPIEVIIFKIQVVSTAMFPGIWKNKIEEKEHKKYTEKRGD